MSSTLLDAQLDAAVCKWLAQSDTREMLTGWLAMARAHLELSGLDCEEPVVTNEAETLSAGRFSAVQMQVVEPSSGTTFRLQAVLHAYTGDINFGALHGALEAYVITLGDDGRAERYVSLARSVLLSAERFGTQAVREMTSDELEDRLFNQLRLARKEAFDMGVGPHMHRFRLALEEALTP